MTSGLAMTDCKIPAANVLPGVQGLRGPLSCLDQARYGIGWGAIGAAMACYDTALSYAKQRKQFDDRPIASHQLVQEKLVWMITEITKAQFLALQVGRLKDQGRVHPSHISMLKMNNVWMARETARMAREILGANGIVDDYVHHAPHEQSRIGLHLRRNARHSQARDRRAYHGHFRVRLIAALGRLENRLPGANRLDYHTARAAALPLRASASQITRGFMEHELSLEFLRVVERAAIASARTMGLGDRHKADQAAVEAMRSEMDIRWHGRHHRDRRGRTR